jgi:tRNA(fMet)-specific endonuclease VapC
MRRLLDTTVFVDVLRGDEAVRERLLAERPSSLAYSAMTRAELLTGVALADDPQAELLRVERLLAPIASLPFDDRCADVLGPIRAILQRLGAPIGIGDLVIAATALASGLVLVTSNTREFGRIHGLAVEDWRG